MSDTSTKQELEIHVGGLKRPDTGDSLFQATAFVLPDHWNIEAQRWKRAQARGAMVFTHSHFHGIVKRMREAKFRVDKRKGSLFSHVLKFILLQEMEKQGWMKDGKVVKGPRRRKVVAT